MSLYVDPRAGSKELTAPLTALGLPVEQKEMEFGDLCFVGRGVKGAPLSIGVEYKKLPDLVQSLANDRLAGHQLPGMMQSYDRAYLLVEGEWWCGSQGEVVYHAEGKRARKMHGAPPAVELRKRLLTLSHCGGLTLIESTSARGTHERIYALYRFWTDTDMDKHKSHLAIAADVDSRILTPTSPFRKKIRGFEGIGFALGLALEPVCKGKVREGLMRLTIEELADVQTRDEATGKLRRLGESRAAKLHKELS